MRLMYGPKKLERMSLTSLSSTVVTLAYWVHGQILGYWAHS